MQNLSFTLLEVLFGLLAVAGITLFLAACWRNVKK